VSARRNEILCIAAGSAGRFRGCGSTLPELLIACSMLAILFAAVLPLRSWLDGISLDRSAQLAISHLNRARMSAVSRRATLRVRVSGPGEILLLAPDGSRISSTRLAGDGLASLDSIRLRPPTLRYNARGQASAGSLYLYKGRRGVRIVSNFVGRLRMVRISP
jgi:type II secretory pathway pseudopilin PulG